MGLILITNEYIDYYQKLIVTDKDKYMYIYTIAQCKKQIKRDYCNNNINLLEIPYWEFSNIEKILKKELLI